MHEMVMVGRRQDNTLAPSVSEHFHYDNNQKKQREEMQKTKRRSRQD
jgi:hypothetical protein